MQRRFGNAAVASILTTPKETVQRVPVPASELMTPAEPMAQESAGVREHPVGEGPAETEATGIEGSAVEPSLLKFLEMVNEELSAWQAYRHTFKAPIPGEALYKEAAMIKDYLQWQNRAPVTKDTIVGEPRRPFDPRIKTYLARRLGPHKLYLLREMVSFSRTPNSITGASSDLAELFGIKPLTVIHEYTCIVTGNRGGTMAAGLGLGGYLKDFEIHYRNNLEMTYVKKLSGADASFFAGYSREWKRGEKSHGEWTPGGKVFRHGREFEVEFEAKGETTDLVLWEPDDFVGDAFTVSKLSGSLGASVGPIGGGGEAKLLELLTFYNSDRGRPLSFNLVEKWVEWAPLTAKNKFKARLEVGVKAGYEAHAGVTWSSKPAAVQPPDVPPPERQETGEWRVLLEAQAFFATGRADVTEEATGKIVALVNRVHAFKAKHPDYKLKFVVTGHASPRWSHPRHGKTKDELNMSLSERRAQHTLEQIRNVFRNVGRGSAVFELQSSPGPEMSVDDATADAMVRAQGSLEARAEHRDPNDDYWHDRRVDIVVYRNEFGIVTEKPPDIAGHSAERASD